jgi:chromosome segregation protein
VYLKHLEITGFKSFADRTRLNFDPGITSIVGPNGCGKTNIVDSIKWAIGEQSAKSLRSGKMEDVIFHGTDDRKGTSMAEVSLTFDNSSKKLPIDFSEVTITRRVFRSGESQYFINKNLCRLKDIDDLFMDTGVGMKAYSVFEQGRMDLVISSKPEDRRFIFEEAAGITKYKEKKRETLHKIEITENNLIRLNDIIKEVQRQINSIERQAAKARRYKKLQEELRDVEVKSYVYQLRELKGKNSEFEKNKQSTEQQVNQLREAIGAKEEKNTLLRQNLHQIDADMSVVQDEKLSIETQLVGNKHQIQYKENKIHDTNERNKIIDIEIARLNKEIDSVKVALEELLKDLEEIGSTKVNYKTAMDEKNAVIKELSSRYEELNNKIHSSKDALVGKTARESNIKNELSSIDFELKSILLRGKQDSTGLIKKRKQKEIVLEELSQMEGVLTSQREAILNIKQAIKDHEERVFSLKDEVGSINKEINEKQQFFSEKRSEYEILSGQKKAHTGYADGVKTVVESKDEFPGVLGLVNDIINVPKEYVTAISSVLGQKMQWVVVDTVHNAYAAANKLNEKNVSQTVLIVNELLNDLDSISPQEGGKRAIDVVGYDKIYEKLVKFLLGNIVIVPSLDINNFNNSIKAIFVNPEGIVFDPHGLISGGKLLGNQMVNVISRDTTINELKVVLNDQSKEILEFTEKYKVIQDRLIQEERQLEIAKNNLYNEEIALGVQENDFLRRKSSCDALSEEIQVLELDEQEGVGKKEELEQAKINKEKELVSMGDELRTLYKEIEDDTDFLKDIQLKKENEEREYTQLKILLVGVEEKENLLDFKRVEMQRQMGVSINSISKVTEEKRNNISLEENLNIEKNKLAEDIQELSKKGSAVDEKVDTLRIRRKEIEKELIASEDALRKERELTDAIYTQLNESQVKLSEISLKISNIHQKIQEEFKMSQENIDSISLDGIIIDNLEQDVLTLRDKIDGMGEVSLMAIEEQDELVKRFEFLNTQRQDLVNAKDTLLKAIAKLNATSKKMFWDTFCQVRENFSATFCQLFGGGKADLVLIDESDMLESGIEIIARPPGKRLQNVSLLSGGEKALTAIALLFSIFKVKPSPFCIMDEIDAPLDDSNIERFANILKEIAKMSQFLIVTHNKRTISAAQSLYGVTMQERGVSRVVSVKFSNAEAKAKAESEQDTAVEETTAVEMK